MILLVETIAQAMADQQNELRYELEHGAQSTGVEPHSYGPDDFEDVATAVAGALISAGMIRTT